MAPGETLVVRGSDPHLALHLAGVGAAATVIEPRGSTITKGRPPRPAGTEAERAGVPGATVWEKAPRRWGLAARGALVESGGPDLTVADLDTKPAVWCDLAPRLYAQAAAAQWDPATAIDWETGDTLPDEIEAAVVQVMTFLIENEQAALMVPARFLGRIHPHYREVAQLLAVQVADEARHIEVFSRRAVLVTGQLGVRAPAAGLHCSRCWTSRTSP